MIGTPRMAQHDRRARDDWRERQSIRRRDGIADPRRDRHAPWGGCHIARNRVEAHRVAPGRKKGDRLAAVAKAARADSPPGAAGARAGRPSVKLSEAEAGAAIELFTSNAPPFVLFWPVFPLSAAESKRVTTSLSITRTRVCVVPPRYTRRRVPVTVVELHTQRPARIAAV